MKAYTNIPDQHGIVGHNPSYCGGGRSQTVGSMWAAMMKLRFGLQSDRLV